MDPEGKADQKNVIQKLQCIQFWSLNHNFGDRQRINQRMFNIVAKSLSGFQVALLCNFFTILFTHFGISKMLCMSDFPITSICISFLFEPFFANKRNAVLGDFTPNLLASLVYIH